MVLVPPTRVEFSGNFEEVEGKNVSLTCMAKGLPPPKFEFSKVQLSSFSSNAFNGVFFNIQAS